MRLGPQAGDARDGGGTAPGRPGRPAPARRRGAAGFVGAEHGEAGDIRADSFGRAGATGSSFEIALRSDMLWTNTSSDQAGVLAEAAGTASRGRLMLQGAGEISGLSGVLRPSREGGLRYDGGDAETGAGLKVGGGLDWARGGLALTANGRMLLAYADESYEEWGYGGSLTDALVLRGDIRF